MMVFFVKIVNVFTSGKCVNSNLMQELFNVGVKTILASVNDSFHSVVE